MTRTLPMTFERRLASYAAGRPYRFGTDLKLTPAQRRRLATKASHARKGRQLMLRKRKPGPEPAKTCPPHDYAQVGTRIRDGVPKTIFKCVNCPDRYEE